MLIFLPLSVIFMLVTPRGMYLHLAQPANLNYYPYKQNYITILTKGGNLIMPSK